MASKRGSRGARGIPGPAGPSGVRGAVGATGARGAKGAAGRRGSQGLTGAVGPSSMAGVGKNQIRLLTSIDKHIDNIYRELDVQMTRTSKLQAQLDELRAKIRSVLGAPRA
jgi:hypothetical protein